MDTTNTMHVKAALDGEIRRFQCQTSFDVLDSTVRRLFLIPTGQVMTMKYLDDESDYCIVSTQLELDYALSLPTTCLKLTLATQKTQAPASQAPEGPKEVVSAENPPQKPAGWWQQHLENRLSWITQNLEQPDLPPHKREKLVARKQWIEAKIAQRGAAAETGGQTEQPTHPPFWRFHPGPWGVPPHHSPHVGPWGMPHPGPWGVPTPHHPPHLGPWGAPDIAYAHPPPVFVGGWGGRCGGMRGGKLENRLNWINAKLEQPNLPQQKVERLTARKEMLQAKLNAQQQQQQAGTPGQQTPAPCGPWQQRIENRLAWITVKLEQPNLPPHKIEKLKRRKEFLQAKLEKSANQTPTTPASGQCATPAPGGFLQTKLDLINFKLQQPNLPPQKLEGLTNRKQMIEAKLAQQGCGGGRC